MQPLTHRVVDSIVTCLFRVNRNAFFVARAMSAKSAIGITAETKPSSMVVSSAQDLSNGTERMVLLLGLFCRHCATSVHAYILSPTPDITSELTAKSFRRQRSKNSWGHSVESVRRALCALTESNAYKHPFESTTAYNAGFGIVFPSFSYPFNLLSFASLINRLTSARSSLLTPPTSTLSSFPPFAYT